MGDYKCRRTSRWRSNPVKGKSSAGACSYFWAHIYPGPCNTCVRSWHCNSKWNTLSIAETGSSTEGGASMDANPEKLPHWVAKILSSMQDLLEHKRCLQSAMMATSAHEVDPVSNSDVGEASDTCPLSDTLSKVPQSLGAQGHTVGIQCSKTHPRLSNLVPKGTLDCFSNKESIT